MKELFPQSLLGKGAVKLRGRQVLYQLYDLSDPEMLFETNIKVIQVLLMSAGKGKNLYCFKLKLKVNLE